MYKIKLLTLFKLNLYPSHTQNTHCLKTIMLMMMPSCLKYLRKNNSVTAPSSDIFLGSDSLKYQQNNITFRSGQKIPLP